MNTGAIVVLDSDDMGYDEIEALVHSLAVDSPQREVDHLIVRIYNTKRVTEDQRSHLMRLHRDKFYAAYVNDGDYRLYSLYIDNRPALVSLIIDDKWFENFPEPQRAGEICRAMLRLMYFYCENCGGCFSHFEWQLGFSSHHNILEMYKNVQTTVLHRWEP